MADAADETARRLQAAYRQGGLSPLLAAMPSERRPAFFRAVVAQARAECARALPTLEQRGDGCGATAIAAATAWIERGQRPTGAVQRHLDDFYNPFWLAFTAVSGIPYECATAAAYCAERAVCAAAEGDWPAMCREAVGVADVVAQLARADRAAAIAAARRWQVELAWALLHGAEPPAWPAGPPIRPA